VLVTSISQHDEIDQGIVGPNVTQDTCCHCDNPGAKVLHVSECPEFSWP
ncbi:unnamed protein product, partial [Rotaria socialis]